MLLSSGKVPLLQEFYNLFQRRGLGEGQSDLPPSAVFANSFSLKYSVYIGARLQE